MHKLILQEHSRGFQLTLNNIVIAKASQYGKTKMIFVFNVLKQAFLISGLTVQSSKQYKTPKKELTKKRKYEQASN